MIHHAIMDGRLLRVSDLVFIYLNNTFVSMTKLFAITGNIVYYIYIYIYIYISLGTLVPNSRD